MTGRRWEIDWPATEAVWASHRVAVAITAWWWGWGFDRVVHYYETTPGITLAVARDTTGDQP